MKYYSVYSFLLHHNESLSDVGFSLSSMQRWFSCKLEQKEKKPCKSSLSLNLPIVLSLQETHRLQKKMAGRNATGRITWFWNEVKRIEINVTVVLSFFFFFFFWSYFTKWKLGKLMRGVSVLNKSKTRTWLSEDYI